MSQLFLLIFNSYPDLKAVSLSDHHQDLKHLQQELHSWWRGTKLWKALCDACFLSCCLSCVTQVWLPLICLSTLRRTCLSSIRHDFKVLRTAYFTLLIFGCNTCAHGVFASLWVHSLFYIGLVWWHRPRWGVLTVSWMEPGKPWSWTATSACRHNSRLLKATELKQDFVHPEQTPSIPLLPHCSPFKPTVLHEPPCFCPSSALGILEKEGGLRCLFRLARSNKSLGLFKQRHWTKGIRPGPAAEGPPGNRWSRRDLRTGCRSWWVNGSRS